MTTLERFVLRFAALFSGLFVAIEGTSFIPMPAALRSGVNWLTGVVTGPWDTFTRGTALHLLGIPSIASISWVSGDGTLGWIRRGLFVLVAALGAAIWLLLDRDRRYDARLHRSVRRLLRFFVGCTLCTYGMWKILQVGQFLPPSLHRLLTPTSDLTPTALLWEFMGISPGYKAFTGLAELAGGLLLFPRRTTTLGALIVIAVMSNVSMMNVAYDVHVKWLSLTLILMAAFLVAPDAKRLLNLFVLNRATQPVDEPVRSNGRRALISPLAKTAYVGYALIALWAEMAGARVALRNVSPLRGIYEVEVFSRNGDTLPPLLTDSTRWRRLTIEDGGVATVWLTNGGQRSLFASVDTSTRRLTLVPESDTLGLWMQTQYRRLAAVERAVANARRDTTRRVYQLAYARPDPVHLVLDGRLGPDTVHVRFRRVDDSQLLLRRWGHHFAADIWIANTVVEQPYAGMASDPRDPHSARVDMPLLYRLRKTRSGDSARTR